MSENGHTEIEITPAMIEAGARFLAGFNSEFEGYDSCVFDIITAALEAGNLAWSAEPPLLRRLVR